MSWIDCLCIFPFWLLTLLLAHRVGWLKGKSIPKKMIGKNIRKVLLLAFLPLAMGCGSIAPATMSYLGDVVLIRGCEVCVSYTNVNENDNSKSLGCFAHYEGHRYQVGDKYPQAAKHSTGFPTECGKSK